MQNKCKDLLLEINAGDIPAGYIKPALYSLGNAFKAEFESLGIGFGVIHTDLGTKDSLICYIEKVTLQQEEVSRSVFGPPEKIAFDKKGNPTKAAIGFARTQGVAVKDLRIETTPKGKYVAVKKHITARKTKNILKEIVPRIIKEIHFTKTMKWDDSGLRFARPIESVAVVFGKENIRIKIGNVPQKKINNTSPGEYLKHISRNCLINVDERKLKIKSLIFEAAKKLKADRRIDMELLEEVNFMVNSPEIFVGEFDRKFLELPEDVLKASMSKYQRVFPVLRKERLINKFVAVIEKRGRDIKSVRKNYENILEARLKDSLFFFNEDAKKPQQERIYQLKDLIFQKELGNMFQKIQRLQILCSFICEKLNLEGSLKKTIERAAELSKVDLVTNMVGEFPSLQGVMGGEYALKSGEGKDVAIAIREHYLPHGIDDSLPKSLGGAVLAISDKMDNVVGFLGMGTEISGSSDPFGIRRNALGLIQIINDKSLRFKIDELVQRAIESYGGKLKVSAANLKGRVVNYIKERIEFLMRDARPIELRKAVLETGDFDIVSVFKRIKALTSINSERYFLEAAKVAERTSNILKGAKGENLGEVDKNLFKEAGERAVWKAYLNSKDKIQSLINKEEYKEATKEYSRAFFKVLHDFFSNVLVNAEDRSLRLNRLAMMKAINRIYREGVCDLSKLPQIVVK